MKATISTLVGVLLISSLSAQPRLIDRDKEIKKYPNLQNTEKIQDKNLKILYGKLAVFWHLVAMAKTDRLARFREEYVDPQNFKNTFRQIKYTPRNTYIRYVEDIEDLKKDKDNKVKGNFILAGLGPASELRELMQRKVQDAQGRKITVAKAISFNQGRTGVELTQFAFIYKTLNEKRVPAGSRRKGLSLYFKKGAQGKSVLDMVVVRIIDDRLTEGVKHVQVMIDPTPNDDNYDDILIFDRYNQKPANVTVLGMMFNTPNFRHRIDFKQKFYRKLLSHFYRLYMMVDNYARRDGNDYNQKVLEKLNRSMTY